MKTVDAFLCQHAAGQCEVFMAFGKPMIVIASTRYEIGRLTKEAWQAWNQNLMDIAANPRNTIASNNAYDAEYIKYFTGLRDVPILPNFCGYTGASYEPKRTEILVGPGKVVKEGQVLMMEMAAAGQKEGVVYKGIREARDSEERSDERKVFRYVTRQYNAFAVASLQPLLITNPVFLSLLSSHSLQLYPHFEYTDLASHPAIVLLPYQVSTMGLFEYYRMNIPIFAPSPKLLARWQVKYRIMSELSWDMVFNKGRGKGGSVLPKATNVHYEYDPNNVLSEDAVEYWVKWADFYQWPHITVYEDFDDLTRKVKEADLMGTTGKMKVENENFRTRIMDDWRRVFHRMFEGKKPGDFGDTEGSWEEGMMEHYKVEGGQCGKGDDKHNLDVENAGILSV